MNPRTALHELLCDLFDDDELHRFVALYLPQGGRVRDRLPSPSCPVSEVASELVRILEAEGTVREVFGPLREVRPYRGDEIREVESLWLQEEKERAEPEPGSPGGPGPASPPGAEPHRSRMALVAVGLGVVLAGGFLVMVLTRGPGEEDFRGEPPPESPPAGVEQGEPERRPEAVVDSSAEPPADPLPTTDPSPEIAHVALEDEAPMPFVALPGGRFEMGSPPDEEGREEAEGPRHTVRVDPFLLATTEVTREQWQVLMPLPLTRRTEVGLPVDSQSWCQALRFANALSEREGFEPAYVLTEPCDARGRAEWIRDATGYRLPTEAEWEYAARAGTDTRFWTGDDEALLEKGAWYQGNAGGFAQPVAQKAPNPWGLYDLAGNLWEWVWAEYPSPYPSQEIEDPAPVVITGDGDRVLRGGSFMSPARYCRSAARGRSRHDQNQGYWIGIRLARNAPQENP